MDLVQIGRMSEEEAREYLETIRWPEGATCPHCKGQDVRKLEGESHRSGLYQCNNAECRGQFTVTTGGIMEDSHIPLQKWVMAFHLLCSSKKGISALQLKRQLGLGSYKTAWFMAHRIRHAMRTEPNGPTLKGTVEADESYIGGKPRKKSGKENKSGFGTRKTSIMALVEREGGKIRVKHIDRVTSKNLKSAIRENVKKESTIYSDELNMYRGIGNEFDGGHETVMHSILEYARGPVHVNTCESFFALLKRGIHGAFHHVSKKHLQRYCDEFGFRWDHRRIADGERTNAAVRQAEGKRLMYKAPANSLAG